MKKEKKELSPKQKTARKVLSIIGNVLSVLIVIVTLIISAITITQASSKDKVAADPIFGYMFMPVLSDSMTGTFEVDDLVIAKKYKGQELHVGDIISFKMFSGDINTHRIVEISYNEDGSFASCRTMGDKAVAQKKAEDPTYVAADHADDWDPEIIYSSRLVAVYKTHWDGFGKVSKWLQSGDNNYMNYFLVVVTPLILLFVFYAFYFIKLIVQNKMAKQAEAAIEAAKTDGAAGGALDALSDEDKEKMIAEYMAKKAAEEAAKAAEAAKTEPIAAVEPPVTLDSAEGAVADAPVGDAPDSDKDIEQPTDTDDGAKA